MRADTTCIPRRLLGTARILNEIKDHFEGSGKIDFSTW